MSPWLQPTTYYDEELKKFQKYNLKLFQNEIKGTHAL